MKCDKCQEPMHPQKLSDGMDTVYHFFKCTNCGDCEPA